MDPLSIAYERLRADLANVLTERDSLKAELEAIKAPTTNTTTCASTS